MVVGQACSVKLCLSERQKDSFVGQHCFPYINPQTKWKDIQPKEDLIMFSKTEPLKPIDQATIDYYVAKGRRARSLAAVAFIKSLFTKATPAPAKAKGTAYAA